MPLRDFDQVRERIHLRVEVRHIVQGLIVVLALVSAAFAGGMWYAGQHATIAAAPAAASAEATTEDLPPVAVAAAEPATTAAQTPIVPVPVAVAAAEPDVTASVASAPDAAAIDVPVAEPTPEQLATAPGERAVPASEVATPPAANAPQVLVAAAAPAPAPAAVVAPVKPAETPVKPVVAPVNPIVAAPPQPVVVATLEHTPRGLGLFGTLRMAPTVSLVAVAPQPVVAPVAEVKPAPQPPHKPLVKPREDDVRPLPVNGHYVIQIKAFFNEKEAVAFEAELRAKGYAPKLTSIEDPGKGMIFRVRLGPFDRLETARAAQKQYDAAEGQVTILLSVP